MSGVSQHAIDFLARMLVIDPSQRPSDVECLAHPWVATNLREDESDEDLRSYTQESLDNARTRDTERANPAELSAFASQLSIAGIPGGQRANIEEEDLASQGPEESYDMAQPKRKRTGEHDLDDEISDPSLDEYVDDLVPANLGRQIIQPPPRKMYGEIDPSALRSSGTLGRNAHAALELPTQGHHDLAMSDSHYEGESEISITDFPNAQGLLPHAPLTSGARSGGAAPSLFGAEAMVEELNMDSPMADAPSQDTDDQLTTSKLEATADQMQQTTAGGAHSRNSSNSSQGLYSATPPQSPKRTKEPVPSSRGSRGPTTQLGSNAALVSGPQKFDAATPGNSSTDQQAASAAAKKEIASTTPTAAPKDDLIQADLPLTTQPQPADTPSSSTTKASEPTNPAKTAPPSTNLPSPATDLGTLTPLPGSAPSPTIKLVNRTTSFGRVPVGDSQVVWPDPKDTRVPKFAFDIIFWRPGVDRDLKVNPKLNWQAFEDIAAIITTRTSQCIWVNGVGLRRGTDCYMYGKIHTGDIITVFEPQAGAKLTGKASESLKFKVEIKIGKSKVPRKEGQLFKVEVEKEHFEKAKRESRESSVKSGYGGSEASMTSPSKGAPQAIHGSGDAASGNRPAPGDGHKLAEGANTSTHADHKSEHGGNTSGHRGDDKSAHGAPKSVQGGQQSAHASTHHHSAQPGGVSTARGGHGSTHQPTHQSTHRRSSTHGETHQSTRASNASTHRGHGPGHGHSK